MSLVKIPMQDLIEQRVTNGLGYGDKSVSDYLVEIVLNKKDKKPKSFLKSHLADLEYRTTSFHSEIINRVLELTPKDYIYWLRLEKENLGENYTREQVEELGKYLKQKTAFLKFYANNYKNTMYRIIEAFSSMGFGKKSKEPNSDIPEFLKLHSIIINKILNSKYILQQKT